MSRCKSKQFPLTLSERLTTRRGGFTLIEVLTTLLLIAIVLPAIMEGISLSTTAGSVARRRTEATGLAESKLNELVATRQWQGGQMSGDFAPDWPDYHWQASVQTWPGDTTGAGLEELDLQVMWEARGRPESIVLSTLVYAKTQQ